MTIQRLRNNFYVAGELKSKTSEIRQGNNGTYLTMKLVIKTASNEEHTVEFFENKTTRSGNTSKVFEKLYVFHNSNTPTIAENGEGIKLEVSGQLNRNHYVGKDGALKHITKLQGKFITTYTEAEGNLGDYKPRAEWIAHVYINNVLENTDLTGEYTKIDGVINTYGQGENVEIYDMRIYDNNLASQMLNIYDVESAGLLNGLIVNKVEASQVEDEDAGFGDVKSTSTVRHSYLTITGGKRPLINDDDEHILSPEQIGKCLIKLNEKLKIVESDARNKSAQQTQAQTGFDIADGEDLPF